MPDPSRFARLLPASVTSMGLHPPPSNWASISSEPLRSKSPGATICPSRKPIRRTAPDSGASTATTLTTGLPAREMMNGSPIGRSINQTRKLPLGFFHADGAHDLYQTRSTRQSPWNPPSFAVSAHEIPGFPHLFHPTTACRDHRTPPRFEARQARRWPGFDGCHPIPTNASGLLRLVTRRPLGKYKPNRKALAEGWKSFRDRIAQERETTVSPVEG